MERNKKLTNKIQQIIFIALNEYYLLIDPVAEGYLGQFGHLEHLGLLEHFGLLEYFECLERWFQVRNFEIVNILIIVLNC